MAMPTRILIKVNLILIQLGLTSREFVENHEREAAQIAIASQKPGLSKIHSHSNSESFVKKYYSKIEVTLVIST